MIPRIFEVSEDKTRLKITPECYTIPELKAIMDKFDMQAEPYLLYVYNHVHPEAPYINIPYYEKEENIVYDIVNVFGDFDTDEPLLKKAINGLQKKFSTVIQRTKISAENALDKLNRYFDTHEVEQGLDGNLSQFQSNLKNLASVVESFLSVQKRADEELKTKMKGNNEIGEY